MDEQVLSQKMSQLSTTITDEKEWSMKYIKDKIENISNHLSERNEPFKQMTHRALSTMGKSTSNRHTEELHQITALLFKIKLIQIHHSLWTTYLQSGTGKLIIPTQERLMYPTDLPIWPKEIKTIVLLTSLGRVDDGQICLNFVTRHVQELDNQFKQYQNELSMKTNGVDRFSKGGQQIIETYVEENLSQIRKEIEHGIELVKYDYRIRALKLTYNQHHPSAYQVGFR
jgi:hypothetical protein